MGKGDKKTRRGKIILGTHGVRRPKNKSEKKEIKPVIVNQKVVKDKPAGEPKEAPEIKETRQTKVKEVKEEKAVKTATKAAEPKPVKNKKVVSEAKAEKAEPKPVKAKKV